MRASLLLSALASVALAADRPADTPMCDYYTKALTGDNTAKNQATVLTLLVNTVVLGNAMPKPKLPGVTFPASVDGLDGILATNASYMGKPALLTPYFDGGLASSNRGGMPVAINFLDDGGAAPLIKGMASNGNTTSNQNMLLNHLYQFFGTLLNCTMQGTSNDFKKYEGQPSMYSVHKYMALNSSQVGFFITQVGLAAKSFGVTDADVTAVGMALNSAFGERCAPAVELIPGSGQQLEAICITSDCPEASNPTCDKYDPVMMPAVSNATLAMGLGNSSASAASGTATMGSSMTMSGSMASGTSMSGGSSSGGSSSSATGNGAAPTQFAGVLAAGGIAAAAFFL